jgi:hypothetical protein
MVGYGPGPQTAESGKNTLVYKRTLSRIGTLYSRHVCAAQTWVSGVVLIKTLTMSAKKTIGILEFSFLIFICPSSNFDIQFIPQDEIKNGSKGYTYSLGAIAWASFGNSTSFFPPES